MRQRLTSWFSLLAVFFMIAAYGTTAQAALNAVGPIVPQVIPSSPPNLGNGFPAWYQDTKLLSLEGCTAQTVLPLTAGGGPACVLLADPGFIPANPIVFSSNYPLETFFFVADAVDKGNVAGFQFKYRASVEGSFAPAVPLGQIVFSRIRVTATVPAIGTYTVTHPYGVETFNVTTLGAANIKFTRDILTPLTGDVGPWLIQQGFPQTVPGLLGPETYIGNPNVILPVTGSPTGNNFVRIVGPVGSGIGGPGIDTLTITGFTVAGKVFTGQIPSPLTIDRATYARDAASSQVDVFVTALPAAIPTMSGTGILTTNLTEDFPTSGKFFTHLSLATPTLPTGINISNSLDVPPILHPVTLVDEVNISLASYNPVTQNLTIKADSRDNLAPLPTLTAVGITGPASLDPLDATGTLVKSLTTTPVIPPLTVTVVSSKGGSATAPVSVVTPPAPPVAVADTATTIGTTPVVINVIGNDTAAGTIDPATVVTATPVNGTAVANSNGTVTFTPTLAAVTAGTASFTYTVKDVFNQVSNSVTVTVTVTSPVAPPPPPPSAPVAVADTAKTIPGIAVTIPVLANDTIAAPGVINPATVTIAIAPDPVLVGTAVVNQVGNLAGNPVGSITFTPVAGFTGLATFTYTVSNSSTPALASNQAVVSVNVAANIPPVANNDVASTVVGVPRVINVKANDTDPDGTIAAGPVAIVSQPLSGSVVANLDGTVTFTPNLVGTYTFTYTVTDNLGAVSNIATVTVSVTSPITDSVTILLAQYTTNIGQWTVEGTTTGVVPLSKPVTLYLGKDLTGQIITTTPTNAADGRWKFTISFGAGALAPPLLDRTISAALPSGASRLAFPVVVK